MKTPEWPALKIIFHFLRLFMPAEFIIVGQYPFLFLLSFPFPASASLLRVQTSLADVWEVDATFGGRIFVERPKMMGRAFSVATRAHLSSNHTH